EGAGIVRPAAEQRLPPAHIIPVLWKQRTLLLTFVAETAAAGVTVSRQNASVEDVASANMSGTSLVDTANSLLRAMASNSAAVEIAKTFDVHRQVRVIVCPLLIFRQFDIAHGVGQTLVVVRRLFHRSR